MLRFQAIRRPNSSNLIARKNHRFSLTKPKQAHFTMGETAKASLQTYMHPSAAALEAHRLRACISLRRCIRAESNQFSSGPLAYDGNTNRTLRLLWHRAKDRMYNESRLGASGRWFGRLFFFFVIREWKTP